MRKLKNKNYFIILIFSIFYWFLEIQARSVDLPKKASSLETDEHWPVKFLPEILKPTNTEELERRKITNTDPFEAKEEGSSSWNSDILKNKERKQFKGFKRPLKLIIESQNDEYDVDPFESVTDWLPIENKNIGKKNNF
ncbi:hypothetical protein Mgra_00000231 [Meloidogyne graminicola]|uniref:Uncharacterized protein n=1 Tax=Meloidogyne graminicola TaxID=189291 RepID=A0A8T0A2T8_9BILA|nr:hypothetical protein Mgra_00000231 [Meloidogyne graminicola]